MNQSAERCLVLNFVGVAFFSGWNENIFAEYYCNWDMKQISSSSVFESMGAIFMNLALLLYPLSIRKHKPPFSKVEIFKNKKRATLIERYLLPHRKKT